MFVFRLTTGYYYYHSYYHYYVYFDNYDQFDNNLYNKAHGSYICIFVCCISAIAGQTAGPNGLTFFQGTLEYPWGTKAEK